jgi:all-trans-8'-apo-beta-carotenal 15,15'-oxygenase
MQQYGAFDHEDWAWAYSSVPPEAYASSEYRPCPDVVGTIPTDLSGTFLRIGPGLFEREGRRYEHVLDGDGFVASFRIQDGKCSYKGRFVETEMYLEERAADRILHRNVFGTQRKGGFWTNAFDLALKNVANTNLLSWSGRLFALWEAGRPYELNPKTLGVIPPTKHVDGPFQDLGSPDAKIRGVTIDEGGPFDQLLGLGRAFTAHPHVVDGGATLAAIQSGQNPSTKQLLVEFVEYDRTWNVRRRTRYAVDDAPAAPHDFSVSENYYGFFQNRFELDNLPFLLGIKAPTQVLQVPLDVPARLHLILRSSSSKESAAVVVVDVPRYFCIHNLCRIEESGDGKIVTLYSNGWNLDDARFFPSNQTSVPFLGSWGGRCPDFAAQRVPPSMLYRTVVDLETQQLISHREVVPGLVMEFPTQEEEESGFDIPSGRSKVDPHAIYCSVASADYTSLPGTGHAKVDTRLNTVQYWWAEPKIFTGEMTPVAKRNGEDGVWLLTLLFDASHKRASLAILDSQKFEQGPVARIHLPHSLAYCLHGTFIEEEQV